MKEVLAFIFAGLFFFVFAICLINFGGDKTPEATTAAVAEVAPDAVTQTTSSVIAETQAIKVIPETTTQAVAQSGNEIYGAATAVKYLRSCLKNPASLYVISINFVHVGYHDYYIYKIDYSAQNGFGGANRDDVYISVASDGQTLCEHFEQDILFKGISDASNDTWRDYLDNNDNVMSLDVNAVMAYAG